MSAHILRLSINGGRQLVKKYIVRLTEDERTDLESLIHKGKVAAHKRLHAEILLKADVIQYPCPKDMELH